PHAGGMAIEGAGPRADGAPLYVTLEPCSHHGRTPPCTNAIISAGVRTVHAAIPDPFPAVNGRGFALLREAGLEVVIGERADEAEKLNVGFLKFVRAGRPFVTAKWA